MKIELSSIIEHQFPTYVREEYPLALEFLKQYYISESGNKITQNLEEYLDLDTFFKVKDTTTLSQSINVSDDTISVDSTLGFPEQYGLIKIDNEIILYTSKTDTTFEGCARGFSGIDQITNTTLNFNQSIAASHDAGVIVDNLSVLFLKIFFLKIKQKIAPGFDNRDFYSGLNQNNFLKRINDFYSSKGTSESFRILFGALYGEEVKVILPRDYLFAASDADYRVVKKIVVESIEGDPFKLINSSLYQDTDGFVPEARGTVTYVEKIIRENKEYYTISLDFGYDRDINVSGTLKSDFIIHPKTLTTNTILPGSSFIDVDSTIGFPENGSLIIKTSNNENIRVSYTFKTFNQFLGCSGVAKEIDNGAVVRYDTFAYGYSSNQEIVKLRITGVLSDLKFIDNNYLYKPGENINIETLGVPSEKINLNSWKFNIPLIYNVESIELDNQINLTYNFKTFDSHIFSIGDNVLIISPSGQKIAGTVVNILNDQLIVVDSQSELTISSGYKIKKEITKTNFLNNPELNIYTSNIQNTFSDYDKNSYILSPSLPSYFNSELNPDTDKFSISTFFTGSENTDLIIVDHPFYSGDSIVFKALNNNSPISSGVYYTKRVDSNTLRLATSRENIYKNVFLGNSNVLLEGTIERFEFTDPNLNSKTILAQNLIRKLIEPTSLENKVPTNPGAIGIFNNGVELLNYKSPQQVFYGPIEEIIVSSSGENYDIINPPNLIIEHSTGQNAIAYPVIEGNLKRIDLIDSGFDYLDEPEFIITGGNGINAKAKANLIEIEHVEQFNGNSDVNVVANTIGFSTYHKFRNSEQVIYNSNTQSPLGGLTNNEKYYVNIQTPTVVTLHSTFNESVLGINSINITASSSGIHLIKAIEKKKIISSISVIESGEKYTNRKNYISGINTSNNVITVKNHKFKDGEIVFYSTPGASSSGLTNNTEYYVRIIDKNNVRLFNKSNTINPDYSYKINEPVKISGFSNSIQYLSYPQIKVEVRGRIGISSNGTENYSAKIIPVFRGEIVDVTVENGGNDYGSEEILDYNNQPNIRFSNGEGAKLLPIISNGKITEIIVLSPGDNYVSHPDIIISGDGFNASLTPIIVNNKLQSVKVISGGFNYTPEKTSVQLVSTGQGGKFETKLKSWRVNLFEKYNLVDYFRGDDGIISNSNKVNGGLQYFHIFASRGLRQSSYTKKIINNNVFFEPDLILNDNKEINSTSHSPILGWAYDGNPIYGPYGYSSAFNSSSIKQLNSGYILKSNLELNDENRPSTALYPVGFFIEDYKFEADSDLDPCNGRYCSTPEFPNGIYAYFTTFENSALDSGEQFGNYKKPKFPYVIGDAFYSTPIEFNFNPKSNQSEINLNELNLIRNTTPYNLNSNNTSYESIIIPSKIKKELINVKSVSQNKFDEIIPTIAGDSYKVNDKVIINNDNKAVVSFIQGKPIVSSSINAQIIENIELLTTDNKIIGYCTTPHNLQNNTFVTLTTYDNNKLTQNVRIQNNNLILTKDVPLVNTTGIVTFFNVYGDLSDETIRSNDVYTINDEKIKVLNVERDNSRIKVIRSFDGTIGINTHKANSILLENNKKITLNNNSKIISEKINKEIYFNPKESVAVGLTAGTGIVSTLYFNNPGIGATTLTLPTRYVYLPNHNLKLNDELKYNNYGNSSISISTNGITTSNLTGISTLYSYPFDSNSIGLSSGPIAIGSTGAIINKKDNTGLLFFASSGLGTYQSFTTKFNTTKADLIKKELSLNSSLNHNLSLGDEIKLNHISGITTVVKFKYNDVINRIVSKETEITGVDLDNNILKFNYHNFKDKELVVYLNSGQNISGLQNNLIYYVIKINEYKIKLASTFDSNFKPIEISLTSLGNGSIFSINPAIETIKNASIDFDLSDVSLGYTKNNQRFPSFRFEIFYNKNFTDLYVNDKIQPTNKVIQTGILGDEANAKVKLIVDDFTPQKLYYNFTPIDNLDNPISKKEKINDFDQPDGNSIKVVTSRISNNYKIENLTNTNVTLVLDDVELAPIVVASDSLTYETNSTTASGGISKVKILKNNVNNKVLPEILGVESISGQGALLIASSDKIGKINSIFLNDIGFEYASDLSLKPKLNLPKIINVRSLFSIKNVDIIDSGKNYYLKPDLILIDNENQNVVEGVEFEFLPDKKILNVIKNTEQIRGTSPYIIPINNSSGITIKEISFNEINKDVTVVLDQEFSSISDFPFVNGDKVLIENVTVGENEKGFNSNLYNYSLFTISNVDPKIGGIGASFSYNMSEFIGPDEVLGTYDITYNKGTVVPQKYFPTFKVNLQRNQFIIGENIFNENGVVGTIEDENFSNNYIKVLTNNSKIQKNELLIGQSSKVAVIVESVIDFDAYLNVKSSSILEEGWMKETGFFNNNQQRLHDNDYYQNFSYSLMSNVPFSEWNEVVSNLDHTAGFKKFSDLVVYSESTGISTVADSEVNSNVIIESDINLNCINNFDLVTENSFTLENKLTSNEVYFENITNLQDYIEAVGNRVLKIDKSIINFSNVNGLTNFITIDSSQTSSYYYKKYFISTLNKWYPEKSSIIIVTNLYNENTSIINQYAEVSTFESLGSFDSEIIGDQIGLRFYPNDFEYSSYYVNHLSYNVNKNYIGISSLILGNTSRIQYNGITRSSGIGTTTILGVTTDISAIKLIVGISVDNSSECEFNEITILNNNNSIYYADYGNLSTNQSGIGTYNVYYNSGKINLDFTPNTNIGNYKVNIVSNLIYNTSFIGVGSTSVENNYIFSSSSVTNLGITTELFRFPNENSGCYSIIYIENSTDSIVSEFVSLYNPILNEVNYTEFGLLASNNTLGIITSYVENNNVVTYFTPKDNSQYKIRCINNIIGTFQNKKKVSLNDSFDLNSNFNFFEAALFGSKKEVEVLSQGIPVFKREFNGSSNQIVNVTKNTINIPNNYFVTGEEIVYSFDGEPISIAPTLIGAAVTDKLPKNLFVVRVNDNEIKVASSAALALLPVPTTLDLTSVGVGTIHTISSKLQNNKSIVLIDNLAQNPLSVTPIILTLAKDIGFYDSKIVLNSITDIKANDLLGINNEIIKVIAVGVGSTNVCFVDRAKLGTSLAKHIANESVIKINCDYNIVDNKIIFDATNFVSNVEEEYNYEYTLSGRVFLRSGILNSNNPTYYDNYIFDDISNDFNAINKTFTLKQYYLNLANISQDNIFVTINNIFQTPQLNYGLQEVGNLTNLIFTGNDIGNANDINTATIPRGGVIVSVGSSQGLGYQPLVSAGGTAIVSVAGTIQAISIGNSGSGYRSQLQTVNVGVQTESNSNYKIEFIGTATVSNGNITGVNITNSGIGYTNFPINYTSLTSSNISIGASIIPIERISGITTNSLISVGLAITNAPIVGIGSTAVTIRNTFVSNSTISIGTTVQIKQFAPPVVVFDAPLSYSNLPLSYLPGTTGNGTGATVSVVVGQGSSVISFEMNNFGYGYKINDKLTVNFGGVAGIPTDISKPFKPFIITVSDIFNDKFSAVRLGQLEFFDPFDTFFDGKRKTFQLKISNVPKAINLQTSSTQKIFASDFKLANSLLIFINDILQEPDEAYVFEKGSIVTFLEAPQPGDTSKIFLYRGTRNIDTNDVDVIEEIEEGDIITINSDDLDFQQSQRTVFEVSSPDSVNTYLYSGSGISSDDTIARSIEVCKLTEDVIINGKKISKDRVYYEPLINPTTKLISSISLASTEIFVENLRGFFDNKQEYLISEPQNKNVRIISTGSSVNYEQIESVIYDGDYGIISGIKTTVIGVGSTGIVFEFYIPQNSILRTNNYVTNGLSGISTNYYFKINNSNIGNSIVSLENDGSVIGIGSTFVDNIYKAYSVSIAQTSVLGVGITNVVRVVAKVDQFVTNTGVTGYYGDFSWGRMHSFIRKNPKTFIVNPSGISTSAFVQRIQTVKYENYYPS